MIFIIKDKKRRDIYPVVLFCLKNRQDPRQILGKKSGRFVILKTTLSLATKAVVSILQNVKEMPNFPGEKLKLFVHNCETGVEKIMNLR